MSQENKQIAVEVNGETKTFTTAKLPELLEQMGLNPRLVAVEYNGQILHRQYWSETQVHEGDCLEIVTIVGGG